MTHRNQRRRAAFALLLATVLAWPTLAVAQTPVEAATDVLEAEGYTVESVRRTLLGRVRIEAERGGVGREIVIDPRSGAVLRDIVINEDDDGGVASALLRILTGEFPDDESEDNTADGNDDRSDADDTDDSGSSEGSESSDDENDDAGGDDGDTGGDSEGDSDSDDGDDGDDDD
ncbi:MAG: hypothetical protein AAGJ96_04845 [Pseudomonadota bacterium]